MDAIEKAAIRVLACCHGYDVAEVERWINEADDEYDVEIASELAEVTSILRDEIESEAG